MAEQKILTPEDKALRAALKKILSGEKANEELVKYRARLVAAHEMIKVFNQTVEAVREYRPEVVADVEKIVLRDTTKSSESKKMTEDEKLAKLLG